MSDDRDIRRAVELLCKGRLVAFPTETVYGLGADASQAAAIARLYKAKGRAGTHPVIVHADTAEAVFEWASVVPEQARQLAARFWPGPLTLILKRASHAGDFLTGGQDTIGLRVPAHPVAQQLLQGFRIAKKGLAGIAAPSANRSGSVSPTTAAHVRADLGRDVDLVLEGGASEVGIESTILDLSRASPVVLRPGDISAEDIANVLGNPLAQADAGAPRVPGSHVRHYAPRTAARLVGSGELDAAIAQLGTSAAVLAFSPPDERVDYWLRMPREPRAYARRLYAALRELDDAGCEAILIETPPDSADWAAVRDRLRRATASH